MVNPTPPFPKNNSNILLPIKVPQTFWIALEDPPFPLLEETEIKATFPLYELPFNWSKFWVSQLRFQPGFRDDFPNDASNRKFLYSTT